MGLVNLTITPRSTKGKNHNRRTRAAGRIPAVVYGKDRESAMVEIEGHPFEVALGHLAGRTALFSLSEGEASEDDSIALLREIQRNPVTDEILHVDLMEIPRGVPVTVPISIQIEGECQIVKSGEASLATSMDQIEISCLPREMPEYLTIDISELELNDKVFVKDVTTPVGEIVSDPEGLVLNIRPQVMELVEEEEDEEGAAEGEEGAESSEEGEEKSED
ncbi:50S ribosomal protein L25 [bacterium DOLZORAL124_64_63]|nr:MAG: 50S ribosomal protein L25 [bacterium DOLZORAL124_64_63]